MHLYGRGDTDMQVALWDMGRDWGSCVPSQLQFNRRIKSNMNIKLHSWDNLTSKQKPALPKELTSGLWVGRAAVLCLCPVTATAQRDRAMVERNRSQFAVRAIPCIRPTGVVTRRKEWAHAVRLVCTDVSPLSLFFFSSFVLLVFLFMFNSSFLCWSNTRHDHALRCPFNDKPWRMICSGKAFVAAISSAL